MTQAGLDGFLNYGDRATSEILGKTVNLSGTVDSYTLDSRYTVTAFITALDPNSNYAPIVSEEVVLSASGDFAISANLPAGDYSHYLLSAKKILKDTKFMILQTVIHRFYWIVQLGKFGIFKLVLEMESK